MSGGARSARPAIRWRWFATLLGVAIVPLPSIGAPPQPPSVTEQYKMKLPDPALLTGFRELPSEDPRKPEDPAHRGTLKRHYVRSRDGARLSIEVSRAFMASRLRQSAEHEIASCGHVIPDGFSGLPLGDWALCNAAPRRGHALLAAQDDGWLALAHLTTRDASATVPLSDLMLLENALRHVFAAPPPPSPPPPGIPTPQVTYMVSGKAQQGFLLLAGYEIVPVAPILRAAGLRVVTSKDIPAIRGWRGDHLVISIAGGARDLVVEGKPVRLRAQQHCSLIDGQLYAEVTDVAVHVGLCTYVTCKKRNEPTFHVEPAAAPRPASVINLQLPR